MERLALKNSPRCDACITIASAEPPTSQCSNSRREPTPRHGDGGSATARGEDRPGCQTRRTLRLARSVSPSRAMAARSSASRTSVASCRRAVPTCMAAATDRERSRLFAASDARRSANATVHGPPLGVERGALGDARSTSPSQQPSRGRRRPAIRRLRAGRRRRRRRRSVLRGGGSRPTPGEATTRRKRVKCPASASAGRAQRRERVALALVARSTIPVRDDREDRGAPGRPSR